MSKDSDRRRSGSGPAGLASFPSSQEPEVSTLDLS